MTETACIESLVFLGFRACDPSKIAVFVVPIVIDAVENMPSGRLASYCCEKLLKRLEQEFNSASTIVFVLRCVLVRASLLRVGVSLIFAATFQASCLTMTGKHLPYAEGSEGSIFASGTHL